MISSEEEGEDFDDVSDQDLNDREEVYSNMRSMVSNNFSVRKGFRA